MHAFIPAISTPLSERELHKQIQSALNLKFTGQIHIAFLFGKTETILVVAGEVRQVYVRNHRLPDVNWETPISRYGAGTLQINPMPERALMFRKILLEEIVPTRPQAAVTQQLKIMFDLAMSNSGPTLFHIQWQQAEGFVLVAGIGMPIVHAVLLTHMGTETGTTAIERMSAMQEMQCTVTVRHGNIQNQAWLELHLNLLLERLCALILNQYGHLTGTVMVQAIVRKTAMLSVEAGWNVDTTRTSIHDLSLFRDAAETGDAYRRILRMIQGQIEPIVGKSLMQYIMNQSIEPIRGVYRTVQEVFELVEDAA